MTGRFDPNDPETYLQDRRTRKWVVRCASCGRVGYRADVPEDAFDRYWFKRKLDPMTLDERGLCETCTRALEG